MEEGPLPEALPWPPQAHLHRYAKDKILRWGALAFTDASIQFWSTNWSSRQLESPDKDHGSHTDVTASLYHFSLFSKEHKPNNKIVEFKIWYTLMMLNIISVYQGNANHSSISLMQLLPAYLQNSLRPPPSLFSLKLWHNTVKCFQGCFNISIILFVTQFQNNFISPQRNPIL